MYEIDFLAVGDGERSGDAIAMRYTAPAGATITGVIDAGFTDDGDAIVDHVNRYYGGRSVDFVLSTHPDADHINGMGVVMRNLNVGTLLIHRPALHGYADNSGAEPAEELAEIAQSRGTRVVEPFQGVGGYNGSFLIAGPTPSYYLEKLAEQELTTKAASGMSLARRFGAAVLLEARAALDAFPGELFFDDAGGTNPRNNSAAILSLMIDGKHMVFPSDAGVPAIGSALDYLELQGRTAEYPSLVALPHHGSRHNIDRETLERLLGPTTTDRRGTAVASVSEESPKYPSPRVANAAGRRGYPVFATSGKTLCHYSPDAAVRSGWGPAAPLPPLAEDDHDD